MDIIRRSNVKVWGSGSRTLLFAHGFGCDQNMWRFVTPAFENHFRIVTFDYVGCGKSDLTAYHPDRYANLNGYVQDVLEICRTLDLKNVIFVGHSVSSMIGLLASIKEPDRFERLILIGPSPCYINEPPDYVGGFERKDIEELLETMERNYIGWANFLAPVVMNRPDSPHLAEELTESFCSTDPYIAGRFARATFLSDNRRDLPFSRKPTLVMQCSEDLIAPLTVGDYLHRNLPNSRLVVLRATGHCPHLSAPDETIQVMTEYLGTPSLN
ncbi:alpha/beta fold hydrolase [Larkinella soli]|uniref:alpha/beta fold hydrolase n=1 Tax=Larkinella soli TaxID=1770527 RepID=UPI00286D8A3A|nr:alpha/beta hydrolase [Larkinella soli]